MEADQRLSKLEIEVSALKEKVSFFSVIYSKFDESLSKIEASIEKRNDITSNDLKDVYTKMQESENKIMAEISRLREEAKEQHEESKKKISDLEKWRWLVIGGASVLGWIISKVIGFGK